MKCWFIWRTQKDWRVSSRILPIGIPAECYGIFKFLRNCFWRNKGHSNCNDAKNMNKKQLRNYFHRKNVYHFLDCSHLADLTDNKLQWTWREDLTLNITYLPISGLRAVLECNAPAPAQPHPGHRFCLGPFIRDHN